MPSITVRKATKTDLPRLGEMGGALARLHHSFDPPRFALWDEVEGGYAWWLGKELENARAVVLVAEIDGRVVGYAYGVAEERERPPESGDAEFEPRRDCHGEGRACTVAARRLRYLAF